MKLVALVVLLAGCGSATASKTPEPVARPAVTTTTREPIPRPTDPAGVACQTEVDAVAARLVFSMPVVCVPYATRPREAAGWYTRTHVAVVYGFPHPIPPRFYASVAAHELGHAWTFDHLTQTQGARYGEIRGITGDWREDYADVFAIAAGEGAHTPNLVAPVTPELIAQLRDEGLLPG